MEEPVHNTTGITALSEEREVEMILGPVFKLRRAGVIRPGIMVLKKSATPEQHKTYNDMLAQGKNWDDIEKGVGKGNLIPKNCDYFTINPIDCNNPQDAETIHKLYADPDGKLRSFPVWFPIDEWWNIIPHSLRCFGSTGLKYKSEIINGEMICHFPKQQADPSIKTFGGRDWGTRKCEPATCNEFQKGECKFGGLINCFIPGVKGMNQWVIPTTSWNALANIKSTLEITKGLLGRVSGLLSGEPFFYIRKVKETVYHTDGAGKRTPSDQWIIILDCDVDPMDLMKQAPTIAIESGKEAVAMLTPGFYGKIVGERPEPASVTFEPGAPKPPVKEAILERIAKIQNIYEAMNWLKKHQAEINLHPPEEQVEIMSAYDKRVQEIEIGGENTTPKPKNIPQEAAQTSQGKEKESETTLTTPNKPKEHDKGFVEFIEKAKKAVGEEKFIAVLLKHKYNSIADIPVESYVVRGEIINELNKMMGKKK